MSVVVINHDYARFLPHSIGSALAQTHREVEVIVVDDASTDDSRDVIRGFGSRITPIFRPSNGGQGAAVNDGALAASGQLVWFLDADDALLPDACATAALAYERQPGMAKFHCPMAVVDADGRWTGEIVPSDPTVLAAGDLRDHARRYRNHGWPAMSGNAFSYEALERILPVPDEMYRQAADSFLCEQAVICGPLVRSSQPHVAYRIHGRNQYAATSLTVGWLRKKIERERCSHSRLVDLAGELGLAGFCRDPTVPRDVAFHAYRLASLRLDPSGHPDLGGAVADRVSALAGAGITAAWSSPHLTVRDRVLRTAWFVLMTAARGAGARRIVAWYMPDGPNQPVWMSWKRTGRRALRPRLPPRPASGSARRVLASVPRLARGVETLPFRSAARGS